MTQSAHPQPTKCVIYCRQSPSPSSRREAKDARDTGRANESLSLETQLEVCRRHATLKALTVIGEFSDPALSGKDEISRRPGLQEALKLASKAPDVVVVVYNLSRLSRRQTITWRLLDDRGDYQLQIMSATEPFDTSTAMGRAMLGMLAVWAQLQADMTSEGTIAALQTLRAKGVHLGPKSLAQTCPDVVTTLQSLYASGGYSIRSLTAHANEHFDAFPTKGGKPWQVTQMARTLKLQVQD